MRINVRYGAWVVYSMRRAQRRKNEASQVRNLMLRVLDAINSSLHQRTRTLRWFR